jgi:hypothetical protein
LLRHDRNERLRGDAGVEPTVAECGDLLVDAEKCALAVVPAEAAALDRVFRIDCSPTLAGAGIANFGIGTLAGR